MDSEAAVIREEMNQTRVDLDQKLTLLEARAERLRPRTVARRYLPDYPLDRALGAVLTFIGTRMALRHFLKGARPKTQGSSSKAQALLVLGP